jgi:Ca-activated chloride channel homolog
MAGFESPWILLFLTLIPILFYIYKKIIEKKKKDAIKFSNIAFIKSALGNKKKSKRNDLLFFLSLLILSLMIIGLSNPYIPLKQIKKGVNVVFVLDISGSMQATDYKPTRFDSMIKSTEILINSLDKKDLVGIITFDTGTKTVAYLTPDKKKAIDKLNLIYLSQGRTAIGDGLAMGVDMATSIPNKKKIIILLSDGVNNAGVINPIEATEFAKMNKIQVFTIGVGSSEPYLAGYDWFGNPQYIEFDAEPLKQIAINTNGKYFESIDEKTLEDIYKNLSKEIEREKEQINIKEWFFIASLLFFLIYLYLRYGGKRIIQ